MINTKSGGTKISVTNLFFYQCESCVNLCLKFLCGLSVLSGTKCINQDIGILADYSRPQSANDESQATSDELKMSNEPNPVLPALSIVEGSEVEWISQITHFHNEPRTMNNLQTNPIYQKAKSFILSMNNKK